MTSLDHAPATAPPAPTQAEQRLGILSADRPCARCGFNLHGATIIREPHYQLVSVRCPECGGLAALQEYPTLSRWTARLRTLFAAQLVLACLLTLLVSGLIMWGMAEGVSSDVCARYGQTIDAALAKHQQELFPDTSKRQYLAPQQINDWWIGLPPSRFLADNGGLRGALNWWGLLDFSFIFPIFFAIGVFWSILFARAWSWRLLVMLLIPAALGLSFYFASNLTVTQRYYYYNSGTIFASMQVGWIPALLTLAFCLLTLLLAALIGRRVARWIIATLLPPRLVTAFAFLWHVDGKQLPKPTSH